MYSRFVTIMLLALTRLGFIACMLFICSFPSSENVAWEDKPDDLLPSAWHRGLVPGGGHGVCEYSNSFLVPLKITPPFIPWGVFCSPYQPKATATARAEPPIPTSVCSIFLCPNSETVLVLKIFNLYTGVNAWEYTWGLFEHCKRDCTENLHWDIKL